MVSWLSSITIFRGFRRNNFSRVAGWDFLFVDFRDYIGGRFNSDFYLSIKDRIPINDNFILVITSKGYGHILAPSKALREQLKKGIRTKDYKIRYLEEKMHNKEALEKMFELIKISKDKDVYLICYEKDKRFCHRSIVHEILEKSREKMRGLFVYLGEGREIIKEEIAKLLEVSTRHCQ